MSIQLFKNTTRVLISYMLLMISGTVFSTYIVPQKKQLHYSETDSSIVFKLIDLADEFRQINPDSSKYYADLSHSIALKSGNRKLVAFANVAKANAYSYKLEFAESILAANEALAFFYSTGNEIGKMKSYAAIGLAYGIKGDYSKAINYSLYALKIAEKQNDIKQQASLMTNMASVYMLSQEYNKALELLNRVIETQSDTSTVIKATALVNIGIIHAINGNFTDAELNYQQTENIAHELNNKYLLQIVYVNRAHLNRFLNNLGEAMENYNKALAIQIELGQYKPMAASLKGIGDIYRDSKNVNQAIKYYEKADSVAKTYNLAEEKADIFLSKALLFETEAKYKEALASLKQYYFIKDSIAAVNNRKQIAAIEAEYQLDKIQAQIEVYKITETANNREIKRQKYIIVLMVFVSIVFITLLAVLIVQKRKKDVAYKQLLSMNLKSMQLEDLETRMAKDRQYLQKPSFSDIVGKHELDKSIGESKDKTENISGNAKYQKSALTEEQKDMLLLALRILFEEEKVYIDSNLSIDDVASKLNVYKKYISQVINEKLGINFTSYINQYRIKEARRMLISEEFKHYSIEGIGQSCGFNSRTTFNMAFNKFTGITPSFFRENAIKKKVQSHDSGILS